ncbi:MAG: sodium-translocating pyrophosphatase, partial [Planctomycetes bacterium]|nr:sodium-translocating pyrophosphatase [Planctomycetota bacterium]
MAILASGLFAAPAFAQQTAAAAGEVPQTVIVISWLVAFAGACAALFFAWKFYHWMIAQHEGDEDMVRIAEYVRQGARAYLNRQYRVVTAFFIVIALLLAALAFGLNVQSGWVPFAFLTGGFFSGLAGWFGMKTATMASSRTAQGAKQSLNDGLQVAFRSGAVMGLTVVGLGLIDITLWFAVLYWLVPLFNFGEMTLEQITVTMLSFGMGASIQALFARVGGGIFTKAADVGADLVGKVEAGIPEDDPRNPATIADNVGDNVGDVAGMGADLYESYAGSILATAALGVAAFAGIEKMQVMSVLLPMVLAAFGIAVSIAGIYLVRTEEGATQRNLLKALARGINASSVGVFLLSAILVALMLVLPSQTAEYPADSPVAQGWALMGVFGAIASGLLAGVVIGWWTEYSTSQEYNPTKRIADQATTGPATVIIAGVAEGLYSVWVPIVVVCIAILLAFGFCTGFDYENPRVFAMGLYGVALAAVGMLSTLGITLATDAYGPIADNAGGNAEMSHQEPVVRERTDALDSLGNTTAATGKGFAIGSAALTALALLAAYVEEVRIGIVRWGDSVEEVIASEDLQQATVKEISRGIFVFNPAGREAIGERNANTTWIAFPGAGGLSEDVRRLRNDDVGETLQVNLQELLDNELVAPMQHIDTPNFHIQSATIPDFVRYYDVSIMNPRVLVGLFLGVMSAFVFCALTMKAVGRAAGYMVEEVRRQFKELPGIMQGTSQPDYARCVYISTRAAQREMILPAMLGFFVPIVVGLLLGVGGVMGMLGGTLTAGFAVAVMMANSGGAWDNAKKYIEQGAHGGKGSDAHKAAVVGDTVGDPFKDTSGPSLNILIKLMSMVSV